MFILRYVFLKKWHSIYSLETTIATSTYSITTTEYVSTEFDSCPFCPKWDTLIRPTFLTLPPFKIRTGRFEDCKNICYLNEKQCEYFIFFTDKFEGNLSNICVLFKETYGKIVYMPGVISGAARKWGIPYGPYMPTTETKSTSIESTTPSTPRTISHNDKPASNNIHMISVGLCILLFFTLGFLVLYCYYEF